MKHWLSLAIGLAILTGCFGNEPPHAASDIPTSAADIDKAQNSVFSKIDPTAIKAGQFIYTLRTQELYSTQEPIENLMQEEGITVTEREDYSTYFDVTVVTEQIDYLAPDKPRFKFKNVYSIGYEEEPLTTEPSPTQPAAFHSRLQEKAGALMQALAEPQRKLEFFNLKVSEDKKYPPQKVLDHSACEGAACLINVTTLAYDIVVTEEGQVAQKNKFEVWLSADVPYFATVLKSCVTTLVSVDTARPLVRQCQSVYDYKFTSDAVPPPAEPLPLPPAEPILAPPSIP